MISISQPEFATFGHSNGDWKLRTHKGVTVAHESVDGVLRLTVTGASGVNWHAELQRSPFPVAAGEILRVSFDARASTPFAFSVWLGQQNPPFASLVEAENHFGEKTMTPAWQNFSHRWVAAQTEKMARLNFVVGRLNNTIEIRNVRWRELTA